jgi:uncharacterized protein
MDITDGEKLILLMLSELYDRVGVEGDIEPDFIRSAIYGDQTWSISLKYAGIPFEDQDTPAIVNEIFDILEMWSVIERTFANLSSEEKDWLKKEGSGAFDEKPSFPGFDGNHETEYMGTASYIVNELGRFSEFRGRNFNSHMPSIDLHRRMLNAYREIRKELNVQPLSVQNLSDILKERVHPTNR